MKVNLLPKSFVWRRAIQRRLRQWSLFFGALFLALACWNAPLVQEWFDKGSQLQNLPAATTHIRDMQVNRIDLAKEVAMLERKIGQLLRTTTNDQTTSILGILTQGIHATEKQVQIQEMQLSINPQSSNVANPATAPGNNSNTTKFVSTTSKLQSDLIPPDEYKLTLRGIAVRSDAITTLVNSIQESEAFPVVELRSTHEQVISDQSMQEFLLECLGHE